MEINSAKHGDQPSTVINPTSITQYHRYCTKYLVFTNCSLQLRQLRVKN